MYMSLGQQQAKKCKDKILHVFSIVARKASRNITNMKIKKTLKKECHPVAKLSRVIILGSDPISAYNNVISLHSCF